MQVSQTCPQSVLKLSGTEREDLTLLTCLGFSKKPCLQPPHNTNLEINSKLRTKSYVTNSVRGLAHTLRSTAQNHLWLLEANLLHRYHRKAKHFALRQKHTKVKHIMFIGMCEILFYSTKHVVTWLHLLYRIDLTPTPPPHMVHLPK